MFARCAAALGLVVVLGGGAGGCDDDCKCTGGPSGGASCPSPDVALVNLGCASVNPPVAKTTGPCAAVADVSQGITLEGNGTGTCHVELTFGNGATSSVDVDFTAVAPPLPGCDESFVAVTGDGSPLSQVSAPDPMCDAGLEADAASEAAVDAEDG